MGEPSVDALYEQVRKQAPAMAGEVPEVPLPVAPGIRVLALKTPTLPPAAHTNAYLVGADTGPLAVVDPGSPYPDQERILDAALDAEAAAGRPLGLVLLTHHHGDHVGGAAALAARYGVPIAAHRNTARRLAGRVPVTRELADGEQIDLGGTVRSALGDATHLTCVHTPGHADGHLVYELGDATIAGDMVAGFGTILIDPSEGDMAEYLASLRLMLDRTPTHLLPAHGPSIRDGRAKLREYIAHRTMREDRVVAALAARSSSTIDELVADAYSDTPKALWPLAARSLRAHLDKLVKERRAEHVDPDRWTARSGSL